MRAQTEIAIDESQPRERAAVLRQRFEISPLSTVAVLGVVAVCMIAAIFAAWYVAGDFATIAIHPRIVERAWKTLLVIARSPAPVLLIALMLERCLPVAPNQRDLTRSFFQDIAWYIADFIREVSWVALYLARLVWMKGRVFGKFELIPSGCCRQSSHGPSRSSHGT